MNGTYYIKNAMGMCENVLIRNKNCNLFVMDYT